MPNVVLTPALRAEYKSLFDRCVIRPDKAVAVENLIDRLDSNRARYAAVGTALGIPWAFIAITHNMESTQNFNTHLHNGDPLTARTRQVPAGRPRTGSPPFTWEESAEDALRLKGLGPATDWSLAGMLYRFEGFNGWGYRRFHPHVLSPYLWSFSNHYSQGKYVADGTWSETAVSKQCGAAVLLRRMAERGLTDFADRPAPGAGAMPLVVSFRTSKSADPAEVQRAVDLQTWLNGHPGIFVKLDGVPGQRTSDAYRAVVGRNLPGDPRG